MYQKQNCMLPYYFTSFNVPKNSDVHEYNTRSKNNLHRSHNPKQYSRLCLKYTLTCLELKIKEKTFNDKDFMYDFNTDRVSRILALEQYV